MGLSLRVVPAVRWGDRRPAALARPVELWKRRYMSDLKESIPDKIVKALAVKLAVKAVEVIVGLPIISGLIASGVAFAVGLIDHLNASMMVA